MLQTLLWGYDGGACLREERWGSDGFIHRTGTVVDRQGGTLEGQTGRRRYFISGGGVSVPLELNVVHQRELQTAIKSDLVR